MRVLWAINKLCGIVLMRRDMINKLVYTVPTLGVFETVTRDPLKLAFM